jgi:hypothetical protein
MHGTGATDSFPTGGAKSQGIIYVLQDVKQTLQDSHSLWFFEFVGLEFGLSVFVRIISENFKLNHSGLSPF